MIVLALVYITLMKLVDSIKTSYKGLIHAKTRSLLTVLGIVIGIASVILLMSIGQSVQTLVLQQVQSTGSNFIFIIPGATKGSRFAAPPSVQGVVIKTLVKRDVDAFKRDPAIDKAAPEVRGQTRVIYENKDAIVLFQGTNEDFFAIRNFKTTQGETFTESDVNSFNRVAVLGSEIAKTLFGQKNQIGEIIRLKNISFRVVGVLEKKGLGPFGVDQDNLVIIPISVAQKQILGIDHYHSVVVEVNQAYTMEYAKSRLESILRDNHNIFDPDKDDFTIRTQEEALDILSNITSILTVFLTAIASISLLVGGIGIMNIMFVSVAERTREIGLRKALGATNADILQQFLIEAIILTFSGGVIGIILGGSLTYLTSIILSKVVETGWVFVLPPQAIILAVLVAVLTGIIFGIYPARKASLKNPIDALRYE